MRSIHQCTIPVLLATAATLTAAFTPSSVVIQNQQHLQWQGRGATYRTRRFLSSQWEDDDDDERPVAGRTTFEDAGESLQKEEDDERLKEMDDFDINPNYNTADRDRVTATMRERAAALGLEKSKITADAIKAAQERALQAVANRGNPDQFSQILDLSQISDTKRLPNGEEIPDMFFEPELEMTEEEIREADPLGEKSWLEQFTEVLKMSEFPTPGDAFKDLIILTVASFVSGFVILGSDYVLREAYTSVGLIPGPEEVIMRDAENIALPEEWTNNMSEEDFMKYQDGVGRTSTSAAVKDASVPQDL